MRFSDWETRLEAHLTSVWNNDFQWGVHDCALFAAGCIEAITGQDVATQFRGTYATEDDAYEVIQTFAGAGLHALAEKIADTFKFVEVEANFAQRGDAALCEETERNVLGVIDFSGRSVMIAGIKGVVKRPLSCIKRAWRIE